MDNIHESTNILKNILFIVVLPTLLYRGWEILRPLPDLRYKPGILVGWNEAGRKKTNLPKEVLWSGKRARQDALLSNGPSCSKAD